MNLRNTHNSASQLSASRRGRTGVESDADSPGTVMWVAQLWFAFDFFLEEACIPALSQL